MGREHERSPFFTLFENLLLPKVRVWLIYPVCTIGHNDHNKTAEVISVPIPVTIRTKVSGYHRNGLRYKSRQSFCTSISECTTATTSKPQSGMSTVWLPNLDGKIGTGASYDNFRFCIMEIMHVVSSC